MTVVDHLNKAIEKMKARTATQEETQLIMILLQSVKTKSTCSSGE